MPRTIFGSIFFQHQLPGDQRCVRHQVERFVGREVTRPLIDNAERRRRIGVRHRLAPQNRTDDVVRITADLVALHSSDPATVYLSAAMRMERPSIAAVETALYSERTVVRHHAMRRTIWVMRPDTARLAHAAATRRIAANERKRTLSFLAGSDEVVEPESWLDKATEAVIDLVRSSAPISTREVGRLLPHLAVTLVAGANTKNAAKLNAHTKVLQLAGFDGKLVRTRSTGTWTSSEYEWAITEDWLDQPLDGLDTRQSAGQLLDQWLHCFGPASENDIRWWFGWTATITRKALADIGATDVDLDSGSVGWVATGDVEPTPDPGPWVALLPGLDATSMGWKERDVYLDLAMMPRLFDRFGNVGPTIWAGGSIVGGWTQAGDGRVVLDVLAELSADQRGLLDAEIQRVEGLTAGVQVKPRFPSPNQKELLA